MTLLLDAGRTDSLGDYCKVLDQFKPILNGAFPHIIVIMAQSSGQGGIFKRTSKGEVQFENFLTRSTEILQLYECARGI